MAEIKPSPSPTTAENSAERRRSHRVYITMPVIIRGKNGQKTFSEETRTASVNAHGCMVRLAEKVVKGQEVAIVNPKTVEELPCTVTFVGQKDSGKTEVGLEFIEPSPHFWRITFPSDDWDPADRKRPSSTSTRGLPQTLKG
jgi:PilZ domain